MEKTLERLRLEAYWVNMAGDFEQHCWECSKCQPSKFPTSTSASMTSIPVGRPWQMIAIDVLKVPISLNNNWYLLVVQEYFTKWGDAIPIPDQKATRITKELHVHVVKLFSMVDLPDILHSDKGQNFESTILRQTLAAFGIEKSHTTAYHPRCDGTVECFNHSLLKLLQC